MCETSIVFLCKKKKGTKVGAHLLGLKFYGAGCQARDTDRAEYLLPPN